VALAARAVQVRLRFIVVLVVAFLVVGRWDVLRNYWDNLTGLAGARLAPQAVSNDTEYFCPMDPGVVSDWPGKCGVCNMELVRRKKGEAVPLPDGVVARMQLSPYRIQLAGVRTSPVTYQPLAREVIASGIVTSRESSKVLVEAELFAKDLRDMAPGQAVVATCDALGGNRSFTGTVRAVDAASQPPRARLEVDDPARELRTGMRVSARVKVPVAVTQPFRSMPADPPRLRKSDPREVFVCPEHPEVLQLKAGRCPVDEKTELEPQPLLPNQRVGWWCPMHPKVTADRPGRECEACGGMTLVARVVTYSPPGQVLALPESAVVDTGLRTVVYVERMPGMFDGVEVSLGPRCGDAYPVIKGLEPGQRVATTGAFLIDAETRLNPSLSAGYFGSGGGARPTAAPTALTPSQAVCPVTGKPLGSMGPPVRVTVAGKSVLLCCEGCEEKLRRDPKKYLEDSPQRHKGHKGRTK
jgi:Cu(I)/Ag(I) efflux system membrane fusion protein